MSSVVGIVRHSESLEAGAEVMEAVPHCKLSLLLYRKNPGPPAQRLHHHNRLVNLMWVLS